MTKPEQADQCLAPPPDNKLYVNIGDVTSWKFNDATDTTAPNYKSEPIFKEKIQEVYPQGLSVIHYFYDKATKRKASFTLIVKP